MLVNDMTIPTEILLLILDKYPLKNTRLICSTLKNEIQTKYWNTMIVTHKHIVDYVTLTDTYCLTNDVIRKITELKVGTEYLCHHYLLTTIDHDTQAYKLVNKCEFKSILPSMLNVKRKNLGIDIVNKYKLLKNRFNDKKYHAIIKNKILNELKLHQLSIYGNSISVFAAEYTWLTMNYYNILLDDKIIENFIEDNMMRSFNNNQTINNRRPKAKQMFKFIHDYINEL
jgi:hypothetical protein